MVTIEGNVLAGKAIRSECVAGECAYDPLVTKVRPADCMLRPGKSLHEQLVIPPLSQGSVKGDSLEERREAFMKKVHDSIEPISVKLASETPIFKEDNVVYPNSSVEQAKQLWRANCQPVAQGAIIEDLRINVGGDPDPSYCGDGRVDSGETCDPPLRVSLVNKEDTNRCRSDCTRCGDGKINGGELCDDGNSDHGDGCAPDCTKEDLHWGEKPAGSGTWLPSCDHLGTRGGFEVQSFNDECSNHGMVGAGDAWDKDHCCKPLCHPEARYRWDLQKDGNVLRCVPLAKGVPAKVDDKRFKEEFDVRP